MMVSHTQQPAKHRHPGFILRCPVLPFPTPKQPCPAFLHFVLEQQSWLLSVLWSESITPKAQNFGATGTTALLSHAQLCPDSTASLAGHPL